MYLLIWVLELAIGEELEGADGEATCLSLRVGRRRIEHQSLLRGRVQRVGTPMAN